LDNILFYTCGPEAYMRMCTYVLQQEGVKPEQIRKENFVIQGKHIIKPLPPDKDTRRVELNYGGEKFELFVEYPDTILRAARKKGISLPYSCEVGRCGNCVAKCLEGKVWHSYNEVLTEKDLQQGMILTCVAHPVGGDVKIIM
jgi:ring-1,2-phenylacetyl-CoA epoxidase subunit PaaE